MRLTDRELSVLQAVADGCDRRTTARQLGIAPSTVAAYLHQMYLKLGARGQAHAVAIGFRQGWLK